MAAKTITGYLINKRDYADDDEIITFISNQGRRYTCISIGSKKNTSKNGRNLFVGNLCTFEIFEARSKEKISRLKTCKTIQAADWRLNFYQPFNLLCECINNTSFDSLNLYKFMEWTLNLFNQGEHNEKELILIILHKFCLILGLNIQVNCCVECGNKIIKTMSFPKHGMVCINHFNPYKDRLWNLTFCKLLHALFNHRYDELKNYYQEYDHLIEQLKQYILDNSGIKLNTI